MGSPDPKLHSKLAAATFADLLDSMIVDVASEAHRAARLGLDPRLNVDEEEELRLSVQARSLVGDASSSGLESGSKNTTDIFGQAHPAIASEVFDCMNCGRPIMAGRFAPHLEKCMGKGRKARLKNTRNSTLVTQRRARAIPSFPTGLGSAPSQNSSRAPPRTLPMTPEDLQRIVQDGTSEESHDDDEKVRNGRN